MSTLDDVAKHFNELDREWPSIEDALLFLQTELGEATDLVLRSPGKLYKRNHAKESYTPERFAEELGDVIYMCIITGIVAGVNPIEAMFKKMNLKELG